MRRTRVTSGCGLGVFNWFPLPCFLFSFIFFTRFYLFIFRQLGKEGDREGEKHQCVVASHASPTGDLALQPRHVPWLGIGIGDPLVHRPTHPPSHTNHGSFSLSMLPSPPHYFPTPSFSHSDRAENTFILLFWPGYRLAWCFTLPVIKENEGEYPCALKFNFKI